MRSFRANVAVTVKVKGSLRVTDAAARSITVTSGRGPPTLLGTMFEARMAALDVGFHLCVDIAASLQALSTTFAFALNVFLFFVYVTIRESM